MTSGRRPTLPLDRPDLLTLGRSELWPYAQLCPWTGQTFWPLVGQNFDPWPVRPLTGQTFDPWPARPFDPWPVRTLTLDIILAYYRWRWRQGDAQLCPWTGQTFWPLAGQTFDPWPVRPLTLDRPEFWTLGRSELWPLTGQTFSPGGSWPGAPLDASQRLYNLGGGGTQGWFTDC